MTDVKHWLSPHIAKIDHSLYNRSMIPSWPLPPAALHPEPGWAHVFFLDLNLPPARLDALAALLSAEETARARRFHSPRDGQAFTAAHGQLRRVLSAYLATSPAGLRFTANAHGKPSLDPAAGLAFNLSHSGSAALLALTFAQPVGVDLERIHRPVDLHTIARRFFSPAEAAALLALPQEQQTLAFFRCWTRKEAYIKARGLGLAIPLDSFQVTLAPTDPPRLSAPDPGWALYALDPGPAYAAALVTWGQLEGIRCWRWEEI